MRYEFTKFTTTAATTLAENIDTANERALEVVVDANRRFVDFAVTTADRFAEQISFELPFADRFPKPAETGERYLDFVERAVAVNREFNDRIVAMLKVDAPAAAEKFAARATEVSDRATLVADKAADKAADTWTDAIAAVRTPAKKTVARTAPARKASAKRAASTAKSTATATRTAAKKTAKKTATTAKTTAKKTAKKVAATAPAAAK